MEMQYARQIESLLEVKRYHDAIKECLKALSSFPDSYGLHGLLARAYLGAEEYVEAEKSCRRLIVSAPEEAYGYFLLSFVAHQCKKFDLELEMAERAAQLEPEDGLYLKRLAEAQLQSGMIKAAKNSCDEMLKLLPGELESHELSGDIALELGDYPLAEKRYRDALTIEADDIALLNKLAIAMRFQKRELEAIETLFAALKRQPDEHALRVNLFEFTKRYLDKNTLSGKRNKVLKDLPQPIQMFYTDYQQRAHPMERFSPYVMASGWVVFIILFALVIGFFEGK